MELEHRQSARGGAERGPLADEHDGLLRRHKVGPLFSALEAHDTWFTGLRREQSPSRASLEPVEDFRLPAGSTW